MLSPELSNWLPTWLHPDLRPGNYRKHCRRTPESQWLDTFTAFCWVSTSYDHPKTRTNYFLFKTEPLEEKLPHSLASHVFLFPQAAELKLMHLATLNSSAATQVRLGKATFSQSCQNLANKATTAMGHGDVLGITGRGTVEPASVTCGGEGLSCAGQSHSSNT